MLKKFKKEKLDKSQSTVSRLVDMVPKISSVKTLAGTLTATDDDDNNVILLNPLMSEKAKPGDLFYVCLLRKVLSTVSPVNDKDDISSCVTSLF